MDRSPYIGKSGKSGESAFLEPCHVERALVLVSILFFVNACPSPTLSFCDVDQFGNPKFDATRIAATLDLENGTAILGRAGAVPAGTQIELFILGDQEGSTTLLQKKITASDDGSFLLSVPLDETQPFMNIADGMRVVLTPPALPENPDVSDGVLVEFLVPVRSRNNDTCIVGTPINLGTTPNDLAIGTCPFTQNGSVLDLTMLFAVNSADSTVQSNFYDADFLFTQDEKNINALPAEQSLFFPVDSRQRGANPWSIAHFTTRIQEPAQEPARESVQDSIQNRMILTLFGQNSVVLLDPCQNQILQTIDQSHLSTVSLSTPIQVDAPIDANDDGEQETSITHFLPLRPQGVAVLPANTNGLHDVYVTYTNLFQFSACAGCAPVAATSTLVRYRTETKEKPEDSLIYLDQIELPCHNAQSVIADPDGTGIWVSCSGLLGFGNNGVMQTYTDGALLHYSPSLDLLHEISMEDFAPATPVILNKEVFSADAPDQKITSKTIVVGSLLKSQVWLAENIDVNPVHHLADGTILTLAGASTDSIFTLYPVDADFVIAPVFSTDTLHILDIRRQTVDAPPFANALGGGILLRPDGTAPRGALDLAADPQQTTLWTLLSLSSEATPINLRRLFGTPVDGGKGVTP